VTAVNPALGEFNDLISFHTGCMVQESRRYLVPGTPFGTLLETTGHGAWQQTGRNKFKAFFRFLLQNDADGSSIGTDNIHLALTLGNDGDTLTGMFESQIKDLADTVLFTVAGNFSATPITV
jgi:hypothetical protein